MKPKELQRAVQTLQFVHLVGRIEISRSTQLAGLGKIMEEVLGKAQFADRFVRSCRVDCA